MDAYRMSRDQRRMRVIIEGIGIIDIDRGLFTKEGKPRVRVDVVSDFDRFGPAPDGLRYEVENADPGPGVVWVTGHEVSRETEQPRTVELGADYDPANPAKMGPR